MFSILPRETQYFNDLDEVSHLLTATAQAYALAIKNCAIRGQHLATIKSLEEKADAVVHRILGRLDSTFTAPFDREDIHSLVRRLDDVIDEIFTASRRLGLCDGHEAGPWLTRQSDQLVQVAKSSASAIQRLRDPRRGISIWSMVEEIHRLRDESVEGVETSVFELYTRDSGPMVAMKWKDIHELTLRAIDSCDDVASFIASIILKNG